MPNNQTQGFSKEVPENHKPQKGLKVVGKIVYWLVIIGIVWNFLPFLAIAVICTAGLGLIPLVALAFGLFKLYKWIFRD